MTELKFEIMGKALRPKSKRKRDKAARAKNSGSTQAYVSTEQDIQEEKKFWTIAGVVTLVLLIVLFFIFT